MKGGTGAAAISVEDSKKVWHALQFDAEAAALSSHSDDARVLAITGPPSLSDSTKSRCMKTHAALSHTARQVYIKLMPDEDEDDDEESKNTGDGESGSEEWGGKAWSAGQVAIMGLAGGHFRRAGQLLDSARVEMQSTEAGRAAWSAAVGKDSITGERSASTSGSGGKVEGEIALVDAHMPVGVDPRDVAAVLRV